MSRRVKLSAFLLVVVFVLSILVFTVTRQVFILAMDMHPTELPIFQLVEQQDLSEKHFTRAVEQHNFDVNQRTTGGVAPLHHAIYYNHKAISYLIRAGANTNSRNEDGNTPLMLAVFSNRFDEVTTLLKFGVDVKITNKNNDLPLRACYELGRSVCD